MHPDQLSHLFLQAPVAICIVSGPNYTVELVNARMLQFLGRTPAITGQPLEASLTESRQQGLIAILDRVRTSGQPYSVPHLPAVLLIDGVRQTRYFSLIFHPYRLHPEDAHADSIFCVAQNITEQVLAVQKLEEEKQRTQLALDAGELGMLATHWPSNTATADKRAKEILGIEQSHLLEDYLQRIHPEDRVVRTQALEKANETGGFDFEIRLLLPGGSTRWIRSRGLVQKDAEGKVTGSFGVVQDITAQKEFSLALHKKVEERTRELAEQKNLLDSILQHSSNGISVSKVFRNEEGVVIDALTILANEAAVRYIGLPREIYLTKKATELEPAVMQSVYYQACIHTLETGEPFIMQYFMEATQRWLELTVSKLDYDHLIQIFTDVTPIKNAQLNLEQSVENLKRSNGRLEEFTRAASHDLKEPIRKLRFFSDRLKTSMAPKMNPEEKALFERVDNAAERMQLLVDDLLAYSQLNYQEPERVEIDLNEKMKRIIADMELLIMEKGAKVEVGALPVVRGHPRQLQQLFQNLVGNALKYHKPDVAPQVTIRSWRLKGREAPVEVPPALADRELVCIEVRDNGIGFAPEEADRIFEVFTRLHGNKEYPGSGIGLSIVRRVVENHGGFVYAQSEVGKGAVFSVLLPV